MALWRGPLSSFFRLYFQTSFTFLNDIWHIGDTSKYSQNTLTPKKSLDYVSWSQRLKCFLIERISILDQTDGTKQVETSATFLSRKISITRRCSLEFHFSLHSMRPCEIIAALFYSNSIAFQSKVNTFEYDAPTWPTGSELAMHSKIN